MLGIYLSMLETEQERQTMAMLYVKHKKTCLYVALKINNNPNMAEDAVHNAFLEIIKNKEKYLTLPDNILLSTILLITRHKMIDILRKNDKLAYTSTDEMDTNFVSNEILPELQLISKEDYLQLLECIYCLDEKSKIILEMRYFHEMHYMEIAKALGITKKNVDMRIYRAKIKARAMMRGDVNGCHES